MVTVELVPVFVVSVELLDVMEVDVEVMLVPEHQFPIPLALPPNLQYSKDTDWNRYKRFNVVACDSAGWFDSRITCMLSLLSS